MKRIILILSATAVLSCACSQKQEKTEPVIPSDLTIERTGLNILRLLWTAEGESYDVTAVERSFEGGGYELLTELPTGVCVYQDRTVTEDGNYSYRVYTVSGGVPGEFAEASYYFEKLPAPADCTCGMTSDGLLISWTDCCVGEEGYIVERKYRDGDFETWKYLDADTEQVTDGTVTTGTYGYRVMAYSGTERSEAATCSYEAFSAPEVTAGTLQTSWYMLSLPFTVTEDGGRECEAGICWSETSDPTVDDYVYTYPEPLSSGSASFGNAVGLSQGKTYFLRAWARNESGIVYSDAVSGRMDAEPEPFTPQWSRADYPEFPENIEFYRTTTSVTGRNVNAWYLKADLSAGNIELRTVKADALTTPSELVKSGFFDTEVYAIVNGGYFGGSQSYSYVLDRGVQKAAQISALTRTKSYAVTRGAFGVTENGTASVRWLYSTKSMAYTAPLPIYDGGPRLTPTEDFPSAREDWDVWSAIGGAPVILYDGKLCFDYLTTPAGYYKSNYELLQSDIFGPSVRPPRTAIGRTADGEIIIMTVDGRGAGGSQGVTLDELARLMKGVGCIDALNLDGGGSTALCVTDDAVLVNSPSDGSERRVLSFVALVAK